jgi:hypothetical protein
MMALTARKSWIPHSAYSRPLPHSDSPYGEYTLAKCVQLLGQDLKDACTQDYFE